jgi:UDP-N-acetylmuramoylalanine--D-glutamate ligase
MGSNHFTFESQTIPRSESAFFHGHAKRPFFRDLKTSARVLILGLGRYPQGSGVASAAWALQRGFSIRIADLADDPEIQKNIRRLKAMKHKDQTIDVCLGPHRLKDLEGVGWIVKNPDVPGDIPMLQAARKRGIPVTSDLELFRQERPRVRLIGITGTRGKSTTAALLHHVLLGRSPKTHLAGNIMRSPLDLLSQIRPRDRVVLELSSWQLDSLRETSLKLDLAMVTMLGHDHLYRYPSRQAYWGSKKSLLHHLSAQGVTILNQDDPLMRRWRGKHVRWFTSTKHLPTVTGALPTHVAAVMLAAQVLRVPTTHVLRQFQTFPGLPGRRQVLCVRRGVTIINDGVATTPEATMAAIESLPPAARILLITGGKDKRLPDRLLARLIQRRVWRLFPIEGSATCRLLRHFDPTPRTFSSLDRAYPAALRAASPGDVILFSPCGSSFEDFRNVQERIQTFEQLVRRS